MIMNSLHESDVVLSEPEIIDSWEAAGNKNTFVTRLFRLKIGRANVMPMTKNECFMDLYTLIGVNIIRDDNGYSYKAFSYEEGYASCRYLSEYYGIRIPTDMLAAAEQLSINKMMKIYSKEVYKHETD